MKRTLWRTLIVVAFLSNLLMVLPAGANPPAPGDPVTPGKQTELPSLLPQPVKPLDQPEPNAVWRIRERQRLLDAGQTEAASALAQTGTDRVLVLLVEFAGTDVITWTAPITPTDPTTGSRWDPLGRADPNEAVYDANGNLVIGDCSNIITQTTKFTYSGPLHNQIPRPISAADRSGQSIWTPDFSKDWFNGFMFGNGVTFNYTRTDNSLVNEDFTGKSVTNFYSDLSSGTYTVTGDVIGWLQLPHSSYWYGADRCPGYRSGPPSGSGSDNGIPGAGTTKSLVRDALDAAKVFSPTLNWAQYDKNGDGIIDRLWIVHAGYGEEDGDVLLNRTSYGEGAVWSHSSSVTPPYSVTQDIAAGPYIMMPENGGIGVFAHEYAHNLGADDLYTYGYGETSAGFWTTMADDWTGYPIGFEPPSMDPMHLDWWGWLNPYVITDTTKTATVKLGQASSFATSGGDYRGAKIQLPDGVLNLAVPVWQGTHYWWGGKQDLANGMMTTKSAIPIPAGTTTLTFDLVYDLEPEWDFLWVQISADGNTWATLTNTNTSCVHDPSWIGPLYGFPEDLCGAGLGGFTGYNANWPEPETQTFVINSPIAISGYLRFWYMTDWGTTYTGPFVDNVKVTSGDNTLFSDNAESGSGKWDYVAPWQLSDGTQTFKQNYYLQWRNVSPTGGYDSALGDSRWRFGPANTGLLVWYNNQFYSDNSIFNYLTDYPGFGPKGMMLVVDSHPEPYREPALVAAGYDNEAGNVTSRGQMRDAPFSLWNTVDFTYTTVYPFPITSTLWTSHFSGRPAASEFHDALGYYPGAENVPGGPVGQTTPRWMTKQWDASTVVPSQEFYGVKAPGYNGTDRFRFDCSLNNLGQVLCYSYASGLGYKGGTGDPREVNGQYGWNVKILSQSDMTATIQVWNQAVEKALGPAPADISAPGTYWFTYTVSLRNTGSMTVPGTITMTVPDGLNLVSYSPTSGGSAILPPSGTAGIPGRFAAWQGYPLSPSTWITFTLVATTTVNAGDPVKTWTAYAYVDDSLNPVTTDMWTTTSSLFAPGAAAVGGTTKVGVNGGSVVHTVQIINAGYTTDTFQVGAVTQPGVWFTAIAPGGIGMQEATAGPISIGPLGPDQRQDVLVFVYVPSDAVPGAKATTTLRATSVGDPTKTSSLALTTSTLFKLYLPVVMK